jgi:AcrR family transcriptional regulator
MVNKPKTKTPVRRRKEARPGELLAAALDLFVERGFAATRLEEIASRAGVSKGTLYLYFSSKEELFKAVIQQGILPMVELGETMVQQHSGDTASLLRDLIIRWWELLGETKLSAIPKLIIAESGNFPDVANYFQENVAKRTDELLSRVLQRGMESGEFRHIDIDSVRELISAPIMMRVIWQHCAVPVCSGLQQDAGIYIQTHIDLLLNGLTSKEPAK